MKKGKIKNAGDATLMQEYNFTEEVGNLMAKHGYDTFLRLDKMVLAEYINKCIFALDTALFPGRNK